MSLGALSVYITQMLAVGGDQGGRVATNHLLDRAAL